MTSRSSILSWLEPQDHGILLAPPPSWRGWVGTSSASRAGPRVLQQQPGRGAPAGHRRETEARRRGGRSGGAAVPGWGVSLLPSRLGGLGRARVGRGSGLCSPTLPGPRAWARAQESHIISGRFQLPQQGAGPLPSRTTGHIWIALPRGVGGTAAGRGGLPGAAEAAPSPAPAAAATPHPPQPRAPLDGRGRPGASVAVGGRGRPSLPRGCAPLPAHEEPGGAGEGLCWPGLPASGE